MWERERRRLHKAAAAARFGQRHAAFGLAGGLLAFLVLLSLPVPDGLSPAAWATVAVAALMAIWWTSEALPVAATALVPLVLFPLLGVSALADTAASYAHPLIFLFLGGFLLAQAMQQWNLHRRLALSIAVRAGGEPQRLIAGFMLATAVLSMWVSNTATVIMMLPIAASVVGVVIANSPHASGADRHRFGLACMLSIAYGANVGGIGTLIGTPPNALLAAFFQQTYGIEVSFVGWMALAMPLVVLMLPIAWFAVTHVIYRFDLGRSLEDAAHGRDMVRAALAGLGPWTTAEKRVALVFAAMAGLWLTRPVLDDLPGLAALSDPGIAIAGALVLFLTPAGMTGEAAAKRLLDWDGASKIAWDVLVLFGGGLALAAAFRSSGLAEVLGTGLSGLAWLPLAAFIMAVTALVSALTQVTSNTATVAALLPVIAALAEAAGSPPMMLAAAAVMAASCAFMLPIATPPNAIVFASGYVTIPEMVRAGLAINLIAVGIITAVVYVMVPLIF